uniref:Cystatin domain-containing protein n=1 Tax=Oncorhynchus kisutch TaxID=8019 RepID=A0A8C7JMZ8_ONCKI
MNWKIVVPLLAVAFIDQATRDALQFAVEEYDKATNGPIFLCPWSDVLTILCLQVVAGMKYFFTVQMARTLCKKGGVEKHCTVHLGPAVWTFVMVSHPWLGGLQLIKEACKD